MGSRIRSSSARHANATASRMEVSEPPTREPRHAVRCLRTGRWHVSHLRCRRPIGPMTSGEKVIVGRARLHIHLDSGAET
eukprot:scaffold31559_cov32-Tisochrysis_lutea.AAC.3